MAAAGHWSATTSVLFAEAPYHDHADPIDRVLGYLDFRASLIAGLSAAEYSCLVGTMTQEAFDSSPAVRDACGASILGHAATLEADIAEALAVRRGRAGTRRRESCPLHPGRPAGSVRREQGGQRRGRGPRQHRPPPPVPRVRVPTRSGHVDPIGPRQVVRWCRHVRGGNQCTTCALRLYRDAMRPAAVLWDMDGTLVDTEPYWIECEHELVAEFDGIWTSDDAHSIVGFDLLDAAVILRDRGGVRLEPHEIVERLLDGVIARAARQLPWRPGAARLLAECVAAGVPCALVTMSWRRLADAVMAAAPGGIVRRVDHRRRGDERQTRPRAVSSGGERSRRRCGTLRGDRGLADGGCLGIGRGVCDAGSPPCRPPHARPRPHARRLTRRHRPRRPRLAPRRLTGASTEHPHRGRANPPTRPTVRPVGEPESCWPCSPWSSSPSPSAR